MAAKEDKNVFASPWSDSDIVLVVEGKELHVHRWILTSQSPVFKSMLDGHFKEAHQDKIPLPEKDFETMQLFLKLLYPASMFGKDRIPLDDGNRLSVLAIADEYQCVNLIQQCINEAKITPGNVLEILPYAVKYLELALPKMFKMICYGTSTSKLEEICPNLENTKISIEMVLAKCHYLESTVVSMQETIFSLMRAFLEQYDALSLNLISKNDSRLKTTADSRCPHRIGIREISKIKSCLHCKEKYKEKFIPSGMSAQELLCILVKGHHITLSVAEN